MTANIEVHGILAAVVMVGCLLALVWCVLRLSHWLMEGKN